MSKSQSKWGCLIVSATFEPEPIVSAKLSKQLAVALAERYDVTVVSPYPSRPFGFVISSQVLEEYTFKLINLASFVYPKSNLLGRFRESYSFGKASAAFISANHGEIKVVYVNTWPLLAQVLTVWSAKKYNLPVILHVQDIYPESLVSKLGLIGHFVSFLLRPLDSWLLRNSSKVVAISDKMKYYLSSTRKLELSSLEVISNWQDETEFLKFDMAKGSTEALRSFTFMYLGNIGPVAGCDLLIDAFASLKADNCKLVIAGSGSMKNDLIEKTMKRKVENIEFLSVPDGNVPQIQAMADVLLLPIKKGAASSSIPSKLPAYMFSAKPIIASVDYDSDTAEAIKNANCGWIVEPENAIKLKDIMQNTIKLSKEERRNVGLKGRDYALEHFSKKSNLPKLVRIIEELVER
ncbi:glycosyltransferase family 4 protein [Schleiferiaceae bacterium]|nr:glycosyltransferase family 4 protein [Schleiferiaceae bacterium]